MLLKRIVTLLFFILISGSLLHAQGLSGEWRVTKVEMKLYSQEDDNLLELKTFTTDSTIRNINARVPVNIRFEGMNYVMQFRGSMETGTYSTRDSVNVLRSASQPALLPGMPYKCFLKNDISMGIEIPASFYRDNTRNLAVKLECSCYYSKKK